MLTGILFVFKTGLAWDDLPTECGWGCGKTCRRALAEWLRAGVWDALHALLLAELDWAGRIDWSRALVESGSVRAPCGSEGTGPNPTDRRKFGSKHHVITDGNGVPLACILTGANRHDVTQLVPLVDAIPPVKGRPRRATARTTRRDTGRNCGRGTSGRSSPGDARPTAAAWMRLRRDILPEIHKAWMALACSVASTCFAKPHLFRVL